MTTRELAGTVIQLWDSAAEPEECVEAADKITALIDAHVREELERAAERAIKFYDLGFAPGQDDELRAAILGGRSEG